MAVFTKFIFAAVLCPMAHAAQFLSMSAHAKDELDQAVFSDLTSSAHVESVESVKRELSSMFTALPKNVHGNIEPATVRYALHRYFVTKHGWFVKGLDPEGGGWNFSSNEMVWNFDTQALVKEQATTYIQQIFHKKLNGRGLGLEDLASFAVMVADLIHGEAVDELEGVYKSLKFSLDEISHEDFDIAIRAFLSQTVVGFGAKVTSRKAFAVMESRAQEMYPEYADIVLWAQDMHLFTQFSRRSLDNPFTSHKIDFDRASAFVKLIVHHFGSVLNMECGIMKDDLTEMQIGNSGRVLISDFYANRDLHLHESFEYLKNLGAVEESKSYSTRLVIPNYISSKSRCLPFSGYYAVCCPDECQSWLGKFEKEFSAPLATTEMIVEVVSRGDSSSMLSPRNVSASLYARLTKIASSHGGKIPLHGRLFMQWMHHMFPLECPFPHITGTVKAVNQDEWLMMNDEVDDAMITDKDRRLHIDHGANSRIQVDDMPWSDVEEVVGIHEMKDGLTFKERIRYVMGLVLLVSFMVPSVSRGLSVLSSKKTISEKQQQWAV